MSDKNTGSTTIPVGAAVTNDLDDLVLAGEFPAPTRQDWEGLVARVLGGSWTKDDGPPDQKYATVTADNIVAAPLYTADDAIDSAGYPGQAPFVRGRTADGNRAGWDVRQRHGHPDPKTAREEIMEDLYGGVSSVWLQLGDGHAPVASLTDVLTEVHLDMATVAVEAVVHLVGVSSLAAGNLILVPALKQALAEAGREDIIVVVGGVIPPQDFDELRAAGAAAIFTPGTVIPDAALELLTALSAHGNALT